MQSYFVHDLSVFLNKYFPVKRKKNALISTKEVELILYLMKLFGLSNFELTNKRYWQLMNTYERMDKRITDLGEFSINGKTVTMPLLFIPYSMWNNGKIDWIDRDLPRFNGEVGYSIKFWSNHLYYSFIKSAFAFAKVDFFIAEWLISNPLNSLLFFLLRPHLSSLILQCQKGTNEWVRISLVSYQLILMFNL